MSTFGPGQSGAYPGYGAYAAGPTYAGFWVRAVSYLIDAVILTIANVLAGGALGAGLLRNQDPNDPQVGALIITSAISFLIPAVYTIWFWVSSGATPGKMAMGQRVVDAQTGGPITTGQAIGRFFAYFISSIVFALGFLWVAFDARKQGWHDKLAGTVVIRR